jgi:hypothetical protein
MSWRRERRDRMSREARPVERLSAADLMSVWPEDKGWPQDIGALAILDGDRLLDADGRVRIDALREHVERRLHRVPRFRQLLCVPGFGLGWPLWVDDRSFDIAMHVGVFPVPPPGDDAAVLRACETLRRNPLPRSRPLWEMWFLPGLPDGRVGLLMRMSHAIADGIAGVATLGAFVDPESEPPETAARQWTPAPAPTRMDLLVDNLHRLRERPGTCSRRSLTPSTRWGVCDAARRRCVSCSPRDAPRGPASTAGSARTARWRSSAADSTSPRRLRTGTEERSTTSC